MRFSVKLYFYVVAFIPMLQRKCNSKKLQARKKKKKSKLFSRMYLLSDNVQRGSLEASASCWRRVFVPADRALCRDASEMPAPSVRGRGVGPAVRSVSVCGRSVTFVVRFFSFL